ncbi:MAG: vWA domain-containing protein, partial [Limisphaerales bacterium]
MDWKLTFGGEVVFDSEVVDGFSTQPFDQFFAAEQSGDYYLQVSRSSANRVQYSFTFETLPACLEPNPDSDPKLPSIGVLNWKDGDSVNAMHVNLKGTLGWDAGVTAMDLVLVMDSSDSLAVSDPEGKRLDAIRSFIDSLPVDAPLRIGLVDFDAQARLLQPLTASWEEILNRLDELDARGGTDIEAAMNVALDEIANHGKKDSIPSLILFSDGEISQGNPVTTTMRSQEMGVTVHTVFLGEPDLQGARWLKTISTATCGNHRSATSASQLGHIFKNLTNRVPVDQIAVTSSALPGMGFIGKLSGSFWEVGEVPVTQDEMEPTELRIVVTTAENPPRSVSSTLRLQYGSVPNQAPVMETVHNIESKEDEPVQIVLAVRDNDDPEFEPSVD